MKDCCRPALLRATDDGFFRVIGNAEIHGFGAGTELLLEVGERARRRASIDLQHHKDLGEVSHLVDDQDQVDTLKQEDNGGDEVHKERQSENEVTSPRFK